MSASLTTIVSRTAGGRSSRQAPPLEQWTRARQRHARLYDRLLAEVGVKTPASAKDGEHVYHIYGIRSRVETRCCPVCTRQGS